MQLALSRLVIQFVAKALFVNVKYDNGKYIMTKMMESYFVNIHKLYIKLIIIINLNLEISYFPYDVQRSLSLHTQTQRVKVIENTKTDVNEDQTKTERPTTVVHTPAE